jgi:hypothetical protein
MVFRHSTRRLAFLALAPLCGCATGTGILPAGPDTYTLTERRTVIAGGAEGAKAIAPTEADQFCRTQGRQFVPAVLETVPNPGGPNTTFTVTFKCARPNDPAVAGYRVQPTPDVVIEQRQR